MSEDELKTLDMFCQEYLEMFYKGSDKELTLSDVELAYLSGFVARKYYESQRT